MILAVDAGNSAVTLGCGVGREILIFARLATSPGRCADEYAVLMERVLSLRGVKLREFEGAASASVVPPLTEVLREAVRLITGHDALVVGAGVKAGLHNGIAGPAPVGPVSRLRAFLVDLGVRARYLGVRAPRRGSTMVVSPNRAVPAG